MRCTGISDDTSRGKYEDLGLYCSQVGVNARQIDLPEEAWNFVGAVVNNLWESSLLH